MANKNETAFEKILNKYGDVLILLMIVMVCVVPLNTVFIICASSLIALLIISRGVKYYLDQKHEEKMMTLQVEKIMKEGPSENEKSPLEEAADEIAVLCGCPEWDYPGQLVRDVQMVVRQRDEALEELKKLRLELEGLKVET